MSPQPPRTTVLLLLPLLMAAFPCHSQVKLKPGPPPLSREELKACFLREDDLKARDLALRNAGAEQESSSAALSQEAKELAEIMRAIDPTDQAAVDEYNRRNDERNRRVEAHNKRTEALNSTNAELQAESADFMATCASRPYLPRDRDAILKELGRGPNKPSESKPKGKGSGGTKSDA